MEAYKIGVQLLLEGSFSREMTAALKSMTEMSELVTRVGRELAGWMTPVKETQKGVDSLKKDIEGGLLTATNKAKSGFESWQTILGNVLRELREIAGQASRAAGSFSRHTGGGAH